MYSSTEANDVDVSGSEKPKYAGCGKTKEYLKKNYDMGAAKKMGICLDWLHNICYWGHECKWDHVLPPKKVAEEEKRWRERKGNRGEKKAKLTKKEKLAKRLKAKRKPKMVIKFTENAWGRTRPSFIAKAKSATPALSQEVTPKPPSVNMTDRTSVYEEMSYDSHTSTEVAPPAYPVADEGVYGPPPALEEPEWSGEKTPEANYVLVEDPVTMESTFPVEGPLTQAVAPTPAPKPVEVTKPVETPTPALKPVATPKPVVSPEPEPEPTAAPTVNYEAPMKNFSRISLNAEAPVYAPSVAGSLHSEVEPYRSYMSVGSLTPAPSVHNDVTYYQPPVVPTPTYVPTYNPQYMQPNVAAHYAEQMNAVLAAQTKMQQDYQADMARRQIEHERLLRQHEKARQLAVREQQMRMNYEAQLAMLREQAMRQARENQVLSRQLQLSRNSVSFSNDYNRSTPLLVQSQMAPVHIPDEEVVWPAQNPQEEAPKPTRPPMSARALVADSIYTENPPAAVGHAQGGDQSNPSLFTTTNTLEGLVPHQHGEVNVAPSTVGSESPQEAKCAPPTPLSELKPKAEPVAESKPEEVGRRLRKKRVKRRKPEVVAQETAEIPKPVAQETAETPKPALELESSVTEILMKPTHVPLQVEAHAPVAVEAPAEAEAVMEVPAEAPEELPEVVKAKPDAVEIEYVEESVEEIQQPAQPTPQAVAPQPKIVEAPKPVARNNVSTWIKLAKAESKQINNVARKIAPAQQKPTAVKMVAPKRKKCIWEVFDKQAARKMNLCLRHVEGLCKAINCSCDKRGCWCEAGVAKHGCQQVQGYNCIHEHKMPTVKIQKLSAEELKYRQQQTGEKKTRMTKRERFDRINRRSLAKAKEMQRQNGQKVPHTSSRPKVVFVRTRNSIAWTSARNQAVLGL